MVGYTEDELLRIEGIGAKAIEELKTGLAEHSLSYLIEDDLAASNDDMSQLLDMVFSPTTRCSSAAIRRRRSTPKARKCWARLCRRAAIIAT